MADKKDNKIKYPKSTLLTAEVFKYRQDALGAVIADDEYLTIDEAKAKLAAFLKGKVK